MGKALEAHGDSGFALIDDRCVVLGKWRFEIHRVCYIGRSYSKRGRETRFWVAVPTNELAFGNEGWFVLNHTAGSICIKGNVERRSVGVGMTECCGLGFPTLPPSLQAKLDSNSSEHISPQLDAITAAVAAEREACAREAEKIGYELPLSMNTSDSVRSQITAHIVAGIRNRSETPTLTALLDSAKSEERERVAKFIEQTEYVVQIDSGDIPSQFGIPAGRYLADKIRNMGNETPNGG